VKIVIVAPLFSQIGYRRTADMVMQTTSDELKKNKIMNAPEKF
jgi:hypothetical protein